LFRIKVWREEVGIEPTEAFSQKPPIRVETCGVHQDHISSRGEKYNKFFFIFIVGLNALILREISSARKQ